MTPSDSASPRNPVVHVYDGIEEYDNKLPSWWLGILYGSMVFAGVYWFVFEVTQQRRSPLQEYQIEAEILRKRVEATPVTDELITKAAADPSTLASAKATFTSTCAPCHGAAGQGQVGPNLTDKFWLHGGAPVAIHRSIAKGFPDKGMPAWRAMLGETRVRQLAAFVVAQRGKNLPGKAPQGTEEK